MKKEKYLPAHIANYFLWQADNEKCVDMTPIKLIKLVYLAYASNLAIYNKKLFNEKIELWKYGPAIPSLYHEFKIFRNSKIKQYAKDIDLNTGQICYPIINQEDEQTAQILRVIWKVYKNYDGWTLSKITHEENSSCNCSYDQSDNTLMQDDKIIERANNEILKISQGGK